MLSGKLGLPTKCSKRKTAGTAEASNKRNKDIRGFFHAKPKKVEKSIETESIETESSEKETLAPVPIVPVPIVPMPIVPETLAPAPIVPVVPIVPASQVLVSTREIYWHNMDHHSKKQNELITLLKLGQIKQCKS